MSLETRIYQKETSLNLRVLATATLKDIRQSYFLARQLAVRDIKAQYRQSYFGILWAFITPLTTALVWVFLNSTGTVKLSDTGVPYPVYVFSGVLLWSIVKDAINAPTTSTEGAQSILTKINFPKEALILSGIYKLLFNSLIKVIILLGFVFFYGVGFHYSLLLFPLGVLGVVLFGTTIGLFLAPVSLLYKDVGRFVGFALSFLMYITPIVYIIPEEGILKQLMELNPFTPIILVARNMFLGTSPEFLSYYLILLGCCIPLLFLGLIIYKNSIPILVERLSA